MKVYELINKGIDPLQYVLDEIGKLKGESSSNDDNKGDDKSSNKSSSKTNNNNTDELLGELDDLDEKF